MGGKDHRRFSQIKKGLLGLDDQFVVSEEVYEDISMFCFVLFFFWMTSGRVVLLPLAWLQEVGEEGSAYKCQVLGLSWVCLEEMLRSYLETS